MIDIDFVTSVNETYFGSVIVKYDSGKIKMYDAYELTESWFRMSNDAFYEYYGFNYIPSIKMQRWYRKKYFGE